MVPLRIMHWHRTLYHCLRVVGDPMLILKVKRNNGLIAHYSFKGKINKVTLTPRAGRLIKKGSDHLLSLIHI